MNDHFDRRIADQQFLPLAASARAALSAAVRALDALLRAPKAGPLPAEQYGNLRYALAEREELR